jgi:hypothetical protein
MTQIYTSAQETVWVSVLGLCLQIFCEHLHPAMHLARAWPKIARQWHSTVQSALIARELPRRLYMARTAVVFVQ